jgi:CHAT domain-containing protein
MAARAELDHATALLRQQRVNDASTILGNLEDRERALTPLHHTLIAEVQLATARCLAAERQWDDAMDAAMDARRVFTAVGEHSNAADADTLMAEISEYLGRSEKAWSHRLPAFQMMSAANDGRHLQSGLAEAVRAELTSGQWDAALSLLEIETRLAVSLNEQPAVFADILARKSRALQGKGDLAGARAAVVAARRAGQGSSAGIDAVEALLVRATDPRRSVELFNRAIEFYRRAAQSEVPWLFLERGRSLVAAGDTTAAERDWRAAIVSLEEELRRAPEPNVRAAALATRADVLTESIRLLIRQQRYEDAFRLVESAHEHDLLEQSNRDRLAALPDAVDVRKLQSLLAPGTTIAEFELLPDSFLIFTITSNSFRIVVRPIPRDRIRTACSTLTSARDQQRYFRDVSSELYDLLVRPLELSQTQKLIIVPDDALQQVPFAALYDRRAGRYLVETTTVAIAPSAAMLIDSARRERALSVSAASSVLAVGDPAAALSPDYGALPLLPYALAEVRSVVKLYRRSTLLSGRNATKSSFATNAALADVIHIAGHAVSDEARPENSRILLASDATDRGWLTADDIARLKLDGVRLVVLSACSTMPYERADLQRKTGIAGSFFAAGVPNVVVRLRDVDDATMEHFYVALHRVIAQGGSTATAVRHAQLEMIYSPDAAIAAPTGWAWFEVVGGDGDILR